MLEIQLYKLIGALIVEKEFLIRIRLSKCCHESLNGEVSIHE